MKARDIQAIESARQRQLRSAISQRCSEVARIANELQRQGMTRTEALQAAERAVPHYVY